MHVATHSLTSTLRGGEVLNAAMEPNITGLHAAMGRSENFKSTWMEVSYRYLSR